MGNAYHITDEVQAVAKETVALRRRVHSWPELGFQETETAKLIRAYLKKAGVPFKTMVGTGTVGLVKGARPGKTILVRADIDGLPVVEKNRVPYKSRREGVMHACGHDGHVAMSLAAAKVLHSRRDRLKGSVKFMFQPAEEGPGGAEPMIKAGLLKNPNVDAAIALHMWNDLPTGKIGVREGPVFAAVDEFTITITGVGGHGAAPHQTVDPVVIAAQVVTNLQSIVSRRVDPTKSAVVTVGKIESGIRFNIIPAEAKLYGTVRSFDPKVRKQLRREIERISKHVSKAHNADCQIQYVHMYPATVNDPRVTTLMGDVASKIVGKRGVVRQDQTMGAEDMSYVLEKVPGCYIVLGSQSERKGLVHPHHSAMFDFDEDALPLGVDLVVRAAERFLK